MKIATIALLVMPLLAQGPLSLRDAARLALEKHPSVEAAAASVRAVDTRLQQARSGRLPKLNYSESWQRSDNPVFVFSSLLAQHQFNESNFAIGPLNRPNALNNFQSQLVLDQVVWDAGGTKKQVEAAGLGRQMAREDRRRTEMAVLANVVRAYSGVLLTQESLKVAREAVASAQADLDRAETVRAAGMTTDADVLAIRVHLAAIEEQEIRRGYDLQIAQAALNEALGLPLDTPHELTTSLDALPEAAASLAAQESSARESRPEARQVRLGVSLAQNQSEMARSSLLPQVSFRFAFEADRQRFINRGGANWLAGASLRWNLFNGFADKARIAEAHEQVLQARAQQRQVEAGLSLEVRRAYLDLKATEERIRVTEAAVAGAEENLRIVKNRYENGLTNVTELLRSETALAETRLRRLSALHDQRLAAAALELAAGTLSAESSVLN
ncbi:MAG TPA: TolC family protein [Bryobacteraceae bacterium]|nr:TolC family protein [Bryobacteraceae bacterium]